MATVLFPLPDRDFDVTEVAVPWRLLRQAGHRVVFATEHGGSAASCDPLLLRDGLFFGPLGAAAEARTFYHELEKDDAFRSPLSWEKTRFADFDALLLSGGHGPGTKQYLGSASLRREVAPFFLSGRPVAAICHGVLVLARCRQGAADDDNAANANSSRSVLYARRTTCLPKYMERAAYLLTAWRLGRHYRTYPAYVEDEVTAALAAPQEQLLRGPLTLRARGTASDDTPAFVVEDGSYLSARWPGDAYLFARRFIDRLDRGPQKNSP